MKFHFSCFSFFNFMSRGGEREFRVILIGDLCFDKSLFKPSTQLMFHYAKLRSLTVSYTTFSPHLLVLNPGVVFLSIHARTLSSQNKISPEVKYKKRYCQDFFAKNKKNNTKLWWHKKHKKPLTSSFTFLR